MTDSDLRGRLDRLESWIERQEETIDYQQALIERQRERISTLERTIEGEFESDTMTAGVSRRTALQAGSLVGLLGLGAGTTGATAGTAGRVGTDDTPVEAVFTKELDGPMLDGTGPIQTIDGRGLTIDAGELRTDEGDTDVVLRERTEPDPDELADDEGMLYISNGDDQFDDGDLVYSRVDDGSLVSEQVLLDTTVVDVAFVTEVPDDVEPLEADVAGILEGEDFIFDTIEPSDVDAADPAYDVYVLSTIGSLDLDTLYEADNVGFVHLDQNNISGELNNGGVRSLSDPGQIHDEHGDFDNAYLEITADHALFDDVGDPGDVIILHDDDFGDRTWFSDYSGETLAEVSEDGAEFDGPAVGVKDEDAQVLLSSSAREGGGVDHDDFSHDENQLVANAIEYAAQQAGLL